MKPEFSHAKTPRRKAERKYMIHQIDKMWFGALTKMQWGTIRQGRAQGGREKLRRFHRRLQNHHLN